MSSKNKSEEIKNKGDLFQAEKEKIYLSKDDKENLAYAEKRHKSNSENFNTLMHLIKLPYYIIYKIPVLIIKKITFKSTREQQKKEIDRLKRVALAKEKARNSNILKELEFEDSFKKIGFKDKLNNYPVLKNIEVDGDKETITLKSNISLNDWINSKEDLETVLNTNIIDIIQKDDKQIVYLETTKKEIPEFIEWNNNYLLDGLKISLGKTALNDVITDLENYTSGIIAGSIGSGKSVTLMCLTYQLLLKKQYKVNDVDINIFDGKGGLDWYYFEEYVNTFDTDIEKFKDTLDKIEKEYERRKLLFAKKAQKLSVWNKKFPDKKLPDIFVIIDEISVITDTQGMETEDKKIRQKITKILADLARLGRATGIHIIIGVQIPNMVTVPGQLKNVLDLRISGFLKDTTASNIILNNALASKLKHIKGRMILDTLEYQSYFIDIEDISLFDGLNKIESIEIDENKTINLSKKRKQAIKRDSKDNIIADIDLTNE